MKFIPDDIFLDVQDVELGVDGPVRLPYNDAEVSGVAVHLQSASLNFSSSPRRLLENKLDRFSMKIVSV